MNPRNKLTDGWKTTHPCTENFTHKNKGHEACCKIDRLYMKDDCISRQADN